MSKVRIFNKFVNDFLNGNNPSTIDCTAYLMNSGYANIYDNLQYFRTIDEFTKYNNTALGVNSTTNLLTGATLTTGYNSTITYYPMQSQSDEQDSTTLIFVNNDNKSTYAHLFETTNANVNKKFDEYIDTFGGFFIISRADELIKLSKMSINDDFNYFAAVLIDDVEAITIQDGVLFGKSAKHPFRGVFDGCGRTLHISMINVCDVATGIFGYTTKSAKIINLKIAGANTTVSAVSDTPAADGTYETITTTYDNAILYNNSYKITLDTIKHGDGDVAVGTLVGYNNGIIDNVLLSANIHLTSQFVPAMYTVFDKIAGTSVVHNAWKDLVSSARNADTISAAITALTDYTNICYPTSLCVNSVGNVIPYVGFFNEGTIGKETVQGNNATYPEIYKQSLDSMQAKTLGEISNSVNFTANSDTNATMLADICTLFGQNMKNNDNYGADRWQGNLVTTTTAKSTTVTGNIGKSVTYRLGPTDKQAYVVGGLIGINDGDVSNTYVKANVDFSACYVGLFGGLAGRGVQGTISSTVVDCNISASQSMYNSSASFNTDNVICSSYNTYSVSALNKPANTTIYASYEYKLSDNSISTVDTTYSTIEVTTAKNASEFNIITTLERMPEAAVKSNFITSDDAKLLVPINSIQFSADSSMTITVKLDNNVTCDAKFTDSTDFTNLYYSLGKNNAYALVDKPAKITEDNGTVLYMANDDATLTLTLSAEIANFTLPDTTETKDVTATYQVVMPISSIADEKTYTYYGTIGSLYDFNNGSWRNNYDSIKLAPVYFIGGMFGEYAYANNQCITASYVRASYNNFSVTSNFSKLNTNAGFAGTITIDSSNKSNIDIYSSKSYALSSNNNARNKIDCAISAGYTNCDDAIGRFVTNRYSCYNQVLPSVVTTRMPRGDEKEQKGHAIYGISYIPQLLFNRGINMGYSDKKYFEDKNYYNNLIPAASAEESTEYINFPGQKSQYSIVDTRGKPEITQEISGFWRVQDALTAAFDFVGGDDPCDAFITNQAKWLPTHYPLYRGYASLNTDNGSFLPTFDTKYCYLAKNLKCKKLNVTNMNNAAYSIINNINAMQSQNYETFFVYTHSATQTAANSFYIPCKLHYESTTADNLLGFTAKNYYSITNTTLTAGNHTSARYLVDDFGTINDVNVLDFGFIPRHENIVRLLGSEKDNKHLGFNAISADDISYLLLVDNNKRPILDVALAADADNAGYTVNFPKLYTCNLTTSDAAISATVDITTDIASNVLVLRYKHVSICKK